ncbi:hypothetical protein BpHYR1_043394 [Brachionus plicatilis]|uniref:Uncharacterized protein n=1 Tax=Brachionus plicatilis TaxID=10195 RepID=A0A3M7RL85_BRAPC|nr:hypothetical protein BpHYR1_043394 [Brachionus plicatilis]
MLISLSVFFLLFTNALNIECTIIKGNGNILKTYRPTTRFSRVVFGKFESSNSSINYKIQIEKPIEIYLILDESSLKDQFTIEADQNLQKFFLLESNGEYLNIKVDYFESDEHRTIYYQAKKEEKDKLDKNEINYLQPTEPIRILISSSRSHIKINKYQFSEIEVFIEKISYQYEANLYKKDSNIRFTCDQRIFFDNQDDGKSDSVEKFSLKSNYRTKSIKASICDESFDYNFVNSPNMIEFWAEKIKNSNLIK